MLNGKFLGQTTANLMGELNQWPERSVHYLQFREAWNLVMHCAWSPTYCCADIWTWLHFFPLSTAYQKLGNKNIELLWGRSGSRAVSPLFLTLPVSAVACCSAACQCPWDQTPVHLNYPAFGKPLDCSKDAPVVMVGLRLWENPVSRMFFRLSPEHMWKIHVT